MTTLTIKIDERSKKGKAFLEFAKTFFNEGKEVEIVAPVSKKKKEESSYNPEFVKEIGTAALVDDFAQQIYIPQHYECPKCGMWLMRHYRFCSRGCCTIDWSEGGEA